MALFQPPRVGLAGALAAALVFAACSSGTPGAVADAGVASEDPADAGAFVCTPIPPPACADPPPRYSDVQGIIQMRCVPCHDSEPDAAWPLQTYRQVADWEDVIRDDLVRCTMPPADGGISMSEDERVALLTWILCGYHQ